MRKRATGLIAGTLAGTVLIACGTALADEALRSYKASPDIYKVIAEKDGSRVIAATWKPGQRDAWHSHPAASLYWLTDCDGRTYLPDGKHVDRAPKAGTAVVQPAAPSHSFENKGATECRAIFFEKE